MAGAVVLIACVQYFIAEAIAAAAWRNPAYSYARNYISDLGVPGCPNALGARFICSPLSGIMNAGFLLEGSLAILALILLYPLAVDLRWRIAAATSFLVHAAGVITVGIWHASQPAANGLSLHVLGAFMAIIGGNVAIAIAGLASRRAGAPKWFALASVGLGSVGLCGAIALTSTKILPPGLLERVAVDSISVWKIATGSTLAAALLQGRLAAGFRVEPRIVRRS
jgi:hypothetical membrane protein